MRVHIIRSGDLRQLWRYGVKTIPVVHNSRQRFAPSDYDQLHHFVAAGVWDASPLEMELLVQADRLVGGSEPVQVKKSP
jgi:hypothetical protein